MAKFHTSWDEIRKDELNPLLSRKVVNGKRITLAQILLKEGGTVPVHKHTNEQISWIVKGSLDFEVGGTTSRVREGDLVLIPSNTPHRVVALEESIVLDTFSPIRKDWIKGDDAYLRDMKTPGKRKGKRA